MKKKLKAFRWKWIMFWGSRYYIYDKSKTRIATILIHHHKIYILEVKNVAGQ